MSCSGRDRKENINRKGNISVNESQDQISPQVGQIWGYQTRPHESESCVVLRKVEELPNLGRIWHVSLFDLVVKNPTVPEKPIKYIMHIPIKEDQLLASLTEKLDREVPEKDWQQGYDLWRSNRGGVFDVPLQECVNIMEESVNQ